MKEVLDLEALGYRFRLRRENGVLVGIFYRHPSVMPPARVTGPLFAALQPKKWTAVDYLKARFLRWWLEALERWEADPEPANDLKHVRELAELAIAGCLPFYDCYNDFRDIGEVGWNCFIGKYDSQDVENLERHASS